MKKKFLVMFLGLFLTIVQVVQADEIQANFTELNGQPVASVGQVDFSLNNNGTIAAELTTTLSSYQGFAFNSTAYLQQSDFSNPYLISSSWGTYQYGEFQSGFVCNNGTATVNCLEARHFHAIECDRTKMRGDAARFDRGYLRVGCAQPLIAASTPKPFAAA
jgi:hypothetical protein